MKGVVDMEGDLYGVGWSRADSLRWLSPPSKDKTGAGWPRQAGALAFWLVIMDKAGRVIRTYNRCVRTTASQTTSCLDNHTQLNSRQQQEQQQ